MQVTASQLEEQIRIKRIARKEIRKLKSVISEQGGAKVKEAFLDVFRALRLAAMDIGNSLRLALGMIFTFDPEKIKKKIDDFDTRRQKINAEWEPIITRAKEAIKSADPILSMAIMGPANFLAFQGIGVGLTAGKTVAEVLTATNWESLINSFTVTLDVNQSLQQFFQEYSKNEEKREQRDAELTSALRKAPVMGRLANLFSEGHYSVGTSLNEQNEKNMPKMSEEEASYMFLKATGLDKKFEKLIKDYKQVLKDTLPPLLEDIEPMLFASEMFSSTDIVSFQNSVKQAKSRNPKLEDKPFKQFEEKCNVETQKMLKNPKAIEKLKKDLGGKEMTPQQINTEVSKLVFNALKSDFDKQLAGQLKTTIDVTKKAIDSLGIDDKNLKFMQDSPDSEMKELASVYKKLLTTYDTIRKDYESKAKSRMV